MDTHFRFSLSDCINFAVVFVCSWLAWSGVSVFLLPLSLVFPFLLRKSSTTKATIITAIAYYTAALWPLAPGAKIFFGHQTILGGVAIVVAAVFVLALPFGIVGKTPEKYKWISIGSLLICEAASPIGFVSPIVSAGVVFPGTGLLGIVTVVLLCYVLSMNLSSVKMLCICGLVAASVLMSVVFVHPENEALWRVKDTKFGGAGSYGKNAWNEFGLMQAITKDAIAAKESITIYPENTFSNWVPLVSDAWMALNFKIIKNQGRTIVFGAEEPLGNNQRQAVVLVRGSYTDEYRQRIPVPIAMWGNGMPLNMFGKGTVMVGNKRAAVLVCYEQFLVLPVVESFIAGADVIIAPSNLCWASGTRIGSAQKICVRSWSMLFGVPAYRPVNL